MLLRILAVLMTSAVITTADEDWCKVCSEHPMCLYQGQGEKCGSTVIRGVEKDQQDIILDHHNKLRSNVAMGQESQGTNGGQPSASNMTIMVWDSVIAEIAQRTADQCVYGHDKCRNTSAYWWVGQNIASYSVWPCDTLPSDPEWTNPIDSWYDEVKDFDKSIISNFQSTTAETGHYTQIVWAGSNTVGCGYSAYFEGDHCTRYYVCNYAPGGNLLGERIYEEGEPRSACQDSEADPRYPGLC